MTKGPSLAQRDASSTDKGKSNRMQLPPSPSHPDEGSSTPTGLHGELSEQELVSSVERGSGFPAEEDAQSLPEPDISGRRRGQNSASERPQGAGGGQVPEQAETTVDHDIAAGGREWQPYKKPRGMHSLDLDAICMPPSTE